MPERIDIIGQRPGLTPDLPKVRRPEETETEAYMPLNEFDRSLAEFPDEIVAEVADFMSIRGIKATSIGF